jgi:hypothetical protein
MARSAALKSPTLSTTDIMNEPIAEGGLHSKCEVLTGETRGGRALFEALGSYDQVAELELVAGTICASGRNQNANVIDLRSRKPLLSGAFSLSWEIIADAAPGRFSTGLFIFEAVGSRQQIEQLATEAKRVLQ